MLCFWDLAGLFLFFPYQHILYHKVIEMSSFWAGCCYKSDVMEMWNVMSFLGFYNEKRNARNSSVAQVCGEFCM
jgi:hypothetical protein